MDIISRLHSFISALGIGTSQFADAAGIPRPTLSQILNGRNKKISNELIEKIHKAYPSLSIMWLLFGEGDMANSDFDTVASTLPLEDDLAEDMENAPDGDELQHRNYGEADAAVSLASDAFIIAGPENNNDKKDQGSGYSAEEKKKDNVGYSEDAGRHSKPFIKQIIMLYSDNSFEICVPK